MNKFSIFIALFIFIGATLFSQEAQKYIYKGNNSYKSKDYKDAEIDYRKSLEQNPNSSVALYNLANSLYKQGNYDEAKEKYEALSNENFSKRELARVFHNLGNSYLKNKKYDESIDSYINALKNNPNDKDTKYNLAYARAMLAKQQQQNKNKNKNGQNKDQQNKQNQNKENGDKNKDQNKQNQDNQAQNQNKDSQNKQNGDKQQNDRADNKKQGHNGQKPKISKEDAERILQAMMSKEKNLQKKLRVLKSKSNNTEKNW